MKRLFSLVILLFFFIHISSQLDGISSDTTSKPIKTDSKEHSASAIAANDVNKGKHLENAEVSDCVTINGSSSENGTVSCNGTVIHENYKNDRSMIFSPQWLISIKSGALQRTGFVALGIMSILLVFFVIRAIRLRHKRSKSRKYGVIASTASDFEMEPLETESIDDDEEETLFDSQQQKFRLH